MCRICDRETGVTMYITADLSFDVELHKGKQYVRTLYKNIGCEECNKIKHNLRNGRINPRQYINVDTDLEGDDWSIEFINKSDKLKFVKAEKI